MVSGGIGSLGAIGGAVAVGFSAMQSSPPNQRHACVKACLYFRELDLSLTMCSLKSNWADFGI
jgi:hypothetical protein